MRKKGFIIDLNKCTGCNACVLACAIENAEIQDKDWRGIRTYNELKVPGLPVFHYSIACNHCEKAPCKPVCPAEAFSTDEATGAVVHHEERCIGCRYCTWACPYDAPK
jgi:Fe-S-cluster-containing dehydrogenase component